MCGIAGYLSLNADESLIGNLTKAVATLNKRGPDVQNAIAMNKHVGLGHARLSIIDTSASGNQPMNDPSGRYTIVFNGEIFNYRQLQEQFLKHVSLKSHSDTEVLLHLYIALGKNCVEHLNGFFAFAIFDNETGELFLARDRYGIKPLHIYQNNGLIVFASELKAILQFPIVKQLNYTALALYLQLNYIPKEHSILTHVSRLLPGHFATLNKQGQITKQPYYNIPYNPGTAIPGTRLNYNEAKTKLRKLVEDAVERRLVSDVPLGTFLSGGIDSSIVTACASKHVKNLNTFSVGYKDEPYFDETKYANLVAKKYGTNHTVFSISNDEMFGHIHNILDYIDEPFADSSSIAVYILSLHTRKRVTVSLSGDGGDELFAGYNKHKAEQMMRQQPLLNMAIKASSPLFGLLPKSRHSSLGNKVRQLQRYADGLKMSPSERYWRWCTFQSREQAINLLAPNHQKAAKSAINTELAISGLVLENGTLNDLLYADMQMVLPNDMLTKVDLMSMANSLEVRVPLLDYTVVNFAFSLPVEYKLHNGIGKRILKDAFADVLPAELFTRPKHGFEVPLLKWIRTGLRSLVEDDLLNNDYVREQGIFNPEQVQKLKQTAFSSNPGDAHALIWGLVVFQYWYKKYFA